MRLFGWDVENLRFHLNWITIIKRCVCSVNYTMGVNDDISDCFLPSRGLGKGTF